jgi:hypothetical protein|tara:strand:- start:1706 stop:2293 length:588 start_codon:yes stop_codon:yes gene_type:complete
MSDKKVAWERWDEDVIEQEIVENFYEENYQEEDSQITEDALSFLEKIPHLVSTPMGMYQLHDKMNVMNQFECWMGYTNFDITHSVKDKIEKIEGVELLSVTSRYKFFLGVGKLFNFSEVRLAIENALVLDDITREAVNIIKDNISEDRYWVIFISKAGEILYTSTNDEDDEYYLTTLVTYQERKDTDGGLLIQNE